MDSCCSEINHNERDEWISIRFKDAGVLRSHDHHFTWISLWKTGWPIVQIHVNRCRIVMMMMILGHVKTSWSTGPTTHDDRTGGCQLRQSLSSFDKLMLTSCQQGFTVRYGIGRRSGNAIASSRGDRCRHGLASWDHSGSHKALVRTDTTAETAHGTATPTARTRTVQQKGWLLLLLLLLLGNGSGRDGGGPQWCW